MEPSKHKPKDIVPLVLLISLWFLFHCRVLFQGQTFVLEDSSRFFYPLWKWGTGVWNSGLIPLWNPDAGFGTPYLADPQMGAWYLPSRIFYWLFSPTRAFDLLIVFHHLWALLGFWFFARGRGFSPWNTLAGCLVFGFSFNTVSLSWATPMLFAYSWIPWIFHRVYFLREAHRNSFLFLSLALAMQMAAGYPLFSYLTLLSVGLDWIITHSAASWKRGWRWEAAWEVAAILVAFLYNAAWILPFKEFIPFSNLAGREGFSGSLGWDDLGTWFNPFMKGHPLHSHPDAPFSVTVYFVGLPTLVALVWAAWNRKLEKALVFFFLALLALSLGETAGLGWLRHILPAYGLVVRSGYWIPFVVWATARLLLEAGEGLEKAGVQKSGALKLSWPISVFLVLLLSLWAGAPWDLWFFWGCFLFLLVAGSPGLIGGDWRMVFLALSLVFSLWPVARSLNFTMDESYYDIKPRICEVLTKPGRIYHSILMMDSLRTISGNSVGEAYEKLKETLTPNWPLSFGLEEVGYSNTLFLNSYLRRYSLISEPVRRGRENLLNFLGVRYSFDEMKGPHWSKLTLPGCPIPVWENQWVHSKWFSEDGSNSQRAVEEVERTPNRIDLTAKGSGKAFLGSDETDYPGWQAKVGDKWRLVQEAPTGFRGLILEDGEESVSIRFRPQSFRLGCFLSLLACGLWAGLGLGIARKPKYA